MPLSRRSRAKPSDFKAPATGKRNKCYKTHVKRVYRGCRAKWWNRQLKKKGIVPSESSKAHRDNKRICAAVAWKQANAKCALRKRRKKR